MSENENTIKIGDYILYNDGRDCYAGTVSGVDLEKKTAQIKVVLTVKDEQIFADLNVPIDKLKKRTLL